MKIPITKPYFGPEELAAIQKPLETGWVVQGPYVKEFEDKFSEFVGAAHSIATTSCTTALQIAVVALGLKPGDEVIVPAFTWVSTANIVELTGATPIFCDIDLDTFNIDVSRIESLITKKTVGIIPVHLFGLSADMAPILEIAERRGLWVVEDCACAFGTRYHGSYAGTFGQMGCFSFHPRKAITTGEGGMVTTNDAECAEQLRSLRDHGASRSDLARHQDRGGFLLAEYNQLGFNYRMTDIQGALGSVQMDRAPELLKDRAARARRYDELLAGIDWLGRPGVPDGYVHGYQSYVCLFRPEEPTFENHERMNKQRNDLMMTLEDVGISTRQGTHAVVLQGYYVEKYGIRPDSYPNAVLADRLSLSLPLYPQMTDDEQNSVCQNLKEAMDA